MKSVGVELINKINDGSALLAKDEDLQRFKYTISENLRELISYGARIRVLKINDQPAGWIRGISGRERKLISNYFSDDMERLRALISYATTLTPEQIKYLDIFEVHRLLRQINFMSEADLSLYPYIGAFVNTSMSERMWSSSIKPTKHIKIPLSDKHMELLDLPDHYDLWTMLSRSRDEDQRYIKDSINATIAGSAFSKNAQNVIQRLNDNLKSISTDSDEPWKRISKSLSTSVNFNDGWGHTIDDSSVEGLMRELHGSMNQDKHEQFMKLFYEQQIREEEERKEQIRKAVPEREVGVSIDDVSVVSDVEMKGVEKRLRDAQKAREGLSQSTVPEEKDPHKRRIKKYLDV